MSTMLPGLTRWAGFSTRRWKIHGWLERQALRRRMVGRGSVMDASLRGRLAPTPTLPRRRGREHGRTRYQCDRPPPRRRGREHGRTRYQCDRPPPRRRGREHGRTRYQCDPAPPPRRRGREHGRTRYQCARHPSPRRRAGGGARPDALRRRGARPPPLAGEGWGGGKPPDPCIPAIRRHPWRMHLRSADEPRDPVAQRAADKRRLANAVRGSLAFVLLLVLVFGLQGLGDARALAVGPGSAAGLLGLLTAPLLHGSPAHLLANASALLILGTLALAVYPRATVRALPLMWLGSGLGAWLLGEPGSWHLGASGLTHGLMFLVFVLG